MQAHHCHTQRAMGIPTAVQIVKTKMVARAMTIASSGRVLIIPMIHANCGRFHDLLRTQPLSAEYRCSEVRKPERNVWLSTGHLTDTRHKPSKCYWRGALSSTVAGNIRRLHNHHLLRTHTTTTTIATPPST